MSGPRVVRTGARRPSGPQKARAQAAPGKDAFDAGVAGFFMQLALDEAAKGVGRTRPNPPVGAVVVKGGRVIGRGHHRRAGDAHAEVVALEAAGPRARGADLYISLEPCNHHGRTPPCTEAILRAGIRRVFYAVGDPNPLVNGSGDARLREAGVEVVRGIGAEAAEALLRPYVKRMRTGMPWVNLKVASTLDGRIATARGDSRWVTGPEARGYVHRLRDRADVVLVGRATAHLDDPQLTTRLPDGEGRDPVRVVVDSRLTLPPSLKLFNQASEASTIVATLEDPRGARAKRLIARGVEVWKIRAGKQGRPSARDLLRRLGKAGFAEVLCEGGGELAASLLSAGQVDELHLFLAPKILGGDARPWVGALGLSRMRQALRVEALTLSPMGQDWLAHGLLTGPQEAPGR
ncbi:MAG TPA: bifunctional diaminohydroxyphosphoribosylaminopyrimidine deaminase/5-amino-6-(5-phosphoribosylamino)uracil reductase RibD [Myxococcaceae bacterium]|nr:bifunctional diaminohydroxyphosphoribosylaminopyrimidine deaminase/5-amino-6-(5-phosphoribosylamino)uracil reductase RibD [Myxococcaceae bacterium]